MSQNLLSKIITEKRKQILKCMEESSIIAIKLFGAGIFDTKNVRGMEDIEGEIIKERGLFWYVKNEINVGIASQLDFTPITNEIINVLPVLKKEYEVFFDFELKLLDWLEMRTNEEIMGMDTEQMAKDFEEKTKARIDKIADLFNSLVFDDETHPGLIPQLKDVLEEGSDVYYRLNIINYIKEIIKLVMDFARYNEEAMKIVNGYSEKDIEIKGIVDVIAAEINIYKDRKLMTGELKGLTTEDELRIWRAGINNPKFSVRPYMAEANISQRSTYALLQSLINKGYCKVVREPGKHGKFVFLRPTQIDSNIIEEKGSDTIEDGLDIIEDDLDTNAPSDVIKI